MEVPALSSSNFLRAMSSSAWETAGRASGQPTTGTTGAAAQARTQQGQEKEALAALERATKLAPADKEARMAAPASLCRRRSLTWCWEKPYIVFAVQRLVQS